ncbi:MAG: CHAT domain-containing protein [Thiolinea sp.]
MLLSACNTGTLQTQTSTQGLSALVRAFFMAGARSVFASHWPVQSQATEQLMSELFSLWQQHPEQGQAEALRRAMLSMLQRGTECGWWCRLNRQPQTNSAHPAYWAAFVIYGEGGGV